MADPQYSVYLYPTSYFVQRVLLALFEKKIAFKPIYVDLMANENLQGWYCKLNPVGTLPLLKDGDTLIPESDNIIDYMEKIQPERNLVPPKDTQLGQEVAQWRNVLTSEVPINVITFGVFLNPELSASGIKSPMVPTRQAIELLQDGSEALMRENGERDPKLKPIMDKRIEDLLRRRAAMTNTADVKQKIDNLQSVFDRIEKKLQDNTPEGWLCGKQYTVADICLTVLLSRMVMLGLDSLYLQGRPLLTKLWERLQARENMKQTKEFGMKGMQELKSRKGK